MNKIRIMTVAALALFFAAGALAAQEAGFVPGPAAPAAEPAKSGIAAGLIALGAGTAIGLSALATGIAQSRIGSAGSGAIAEKPETAGTIILLVAIPETMVILGFVVAIVMLFVL